MIAAWMLVSVLLGGAVVLGASALDGVCRALRLSRRWTWAGALSALVILTALVPVRRASDAGALRLPTGVSTTAVNAAAPAGAPSPGARLLAAVRAPIDVPVARLVRPVLRVVPRALDRWLLIAWIACSAALVVLAVAVYRRFRRAQRTWLVSSLHGERVHVAPAGGPAVFGLVRGCIVVPPWLVECASDVQRVVVAHEREHVRARDPMLLMLGAACVMLLPWNPAAWWMLARLRLAVELDCDRRVLASGVRTRDYATLLIDLAGRATGMSFTAPLVGLTMLAERTTHLERRIVAMSAPRSRHAAGRIIIGSLVALTAALAACEARLPTSVDVDNMTAASAARAATNAGFMIKDTLALGTYYVDGRSVSAADARAIPPEKIATIMVTRDAADQSRGSVHITTREAALRAERGGGTYTITAPKGGTYTVTAPKTEIGGAAHDSMHFAGLIYIDGKRTDQSGMKALSPAEIASIEVIKGPRAAELYPNEPAAAQGVIQITTKRGQ